MHGKGEGSSRDKKSLGRILFENVPAWITAILAIIAFGAGYGTRTVVQNPAPTTGPHSASTGPSIADTQTPSSPSTPPGDSLTRTFAVPFVSNG